MCYDISMKFFKNFLFIFILILCSLLENSSQNTSFFYPTYFTNISSYYGYREIFNGTFFHNGIDFLAPQGSDVFSCTEGIVTQIGFSTSFGNYITILHSNNISSLYGHRSSYHFVSIGDTVKEKQKISTVGPKILDNGIQNGITTGPHLHFTLFDSNKNTLDPLLYIKKE